MNKERKEDLKDLCKILSIEMSDLYLLSTALTHTSYAHESKEIPKPAHSERLEFLGDSVLGLVVSTYMYRRFPKMDEGELTKLRAHLVCEASLAKHARKVGLGKYILLGKGELISGGRERASILADAFESVIGAYYLDQGLEKVNDYILNLMQEELLMMAKHGLCYDYKTRLQEMVQKDGIVEIVYQLMDATGPDHDKIFETAVLINGKVNGQGSGKSKKEAEQHAAKQALLKLGDNVC
ncbi:MAG TPA: ribonuclease III [Candidatus Avacidaminococcus intestinavium]|uniref:Ribonuclease 3 n=1 Tax=Candidatus Avacidaminococcus intestinavium TaxID=2840684 RepID=A0A9D1SKZ1_9FIRM|nr:ribonuclease III [Candidatus Avacidaminococcus intestinavium]